MSRFCFSKRYDCLLPWLSVLVVASITLLLQPLLSTAFAVHAQSDLADTLIWDKRDTKEAILFIGRINADTTADTLVGKRSRNLHHMPDRIIWGGVNRGRKFTQFRYPKWVGLSGSVSIMDVNLDTIPDLVIQLRGKIPDTTQSNGQSHEQLRDTARIIAVFGQRGLDTLKTIDIGDVMTRFQSIPFFAIDLFEQQTLNSPGVRDLSGGTSYILTPIQPTRSRDSSRTIKIDDGKQPVFTAYPNPTNNGINIVLNGAPAGNYRLRVLSVNGAVYLEQMVETHEGENIARTLELNTAPTGYYVIQVFSQSEIIATYPFVVVH